MCVSPRTTHTHCHTLTPLNGRKPGLALLLALPLPLLALPGPALVLIRPGPDLDKQAQAAGQNAQARPQARLQLEEGGDGQGTRVGGGHVLQLVMRKSQRCVKVLEHAARVTSWSPRRCMTATQAGLSP